MVIPGQLQAQMIFLSFCQNFQKKKKFLMLKILKNSIKNVIQIKYLGSQT
jgi:hypothetical protein